jgi:hypothetical protein
MPSVVYALKNSERKYFYSPFPFSLSVSTFPYEKFSNKIYYNVLLAALLQIANPEYGWITVFGRPADRLNKTLF